MKLNTKPFYHSSAAEPTYIGGFKILEDYRGGDQKPLVKDGTTYYELAYVYEPKVRAWVLFYAINNKNRVFLAAYPNDGTEIKTEKLDAVNADEYGNPLAAAKIMYLTEMRIRELMKMATGQALEPPSIDELLNET